MDTLWYHTLVGPETLKRVPRVGGDRPSCDRTAVRRVLPHAYADARAHVEELPASKLRIELGRLQLRLAFGDWISAPRLSARRLSYWSRSSPLLGRWTTTPESAICGALGGTLRLGHLSA